jgi:nicotinamidase-related amidase
MEPDTALIVIDVQQAFDDPDFGPRNNPAAEANIARLGKAWTEAGRPVVRVRHRRDSGPFAADGPGFALKPEVADLTPALEIEKSTHSAFGGTPSLHAWLSERGITDVVICGIQTNRCCETTARDATDLGYRMSFVLDATFTFDKADADGVTWTADQLSAATAASLHEYFGRVVRTDDLLM